MSKYRNKYSYQPTPTGCPWAAIGYTLAGVIVLIAALVGALILINC